MAEICGNCINLDWKNKGTYSREKYWCKEGHGYREPRDRACSYDYVQKGNSSSSSGWKPSGFSWITLIANKFGQIFCNDCGITTSLINFGQTFLLSNPEYNIALENAQDTLTQDEELSYFASLTKNFILPWLDCLKCQNYEGAMETFKNMINQILETMGIDISLVKSSQQLTLTN